MEQTSWKPFGKILIGPFPSQLAPRLGAVGFRAPRPDGAARDGVRDGTAALEDVVPVEGFLCNASQGFLAATGVVVGFEAVVVPVAGLEAVVPVAGLEAVVPVAGLDAPVFAALFGLVLT